MDIAVSRNRGYLAPLRKFERELEKARGKRRERRRRSCDDSEVAKSDANGEIMIMTRKSTRSPSRDTTTPRNPQDYQEQGKRTRRLVPGLKATGARPRCFARADRLVRGSGRLALLEHVKLQ